MPESAPAPRPAATLMLLRDGATGLEVLMIKRHAESGFAAGAMVFPGGRVDEADGAFGAHCAPSPGVGAVELGFRVAAIREAFEEANVLLARSHGGGELVGGTALAAHETVGLADLLARRSLVLATDLLVPFAHWITMPGRPKRYDTWFFLAPAPPQQEARHDGREAVEAVWVGPEAAIASADQGRIAIVFPTRMNLLKLARSRTVAAALAAAKAAPVVTVCPEVAESPEGPVYRIPLAAGYGVAEVPARGIPRA